MSFILRRWLFLQVSALRYCSVIVFSESKFRWFRVRVKLIPNAPSNSHSHPCQEKEQVSVNAFFCQKWPLSTYIHCRLGQCERPLETFNSLFTLLRVIPKQRKVDVFSSYWTDGYDQDVWQVVKIHMKLKKSCVDQTLMKVFPKSVFVLLLGVQDVDNLPINDKMPFYSHVRVFVPANCVSFSSPEMSFW